MTNFMSFDRTPDEDDHENLVLVKNIGRQVVSPVSNTTNMQGKVMKAPMVRSAQGSKRSSQNPQDKYEIEES